MTNEALATEPIPRTALPHPEPPTPNRPHTPRGQQPDGTIRTTGWIHIGPIPLSSGLWSALAGATLGFATLDTTGWWPLLLATTSYTAWRVTNTRLRPASRARNRARVRADQLTPGTAIRIDGPAGPVGIVDKTTMACLDQVLIRFTGGTQRFLHTNTRCHVVDIQN